MQVSSAELARYDELCKMALDFARNNDHNTLLNMIKAGFNVDFKDHRGNTLLMLACYNGSYECAKMLLENGASVDMKNDKGQTPLAGVCFKGYLDIVKLLVSYGANINENNGLGMTPYTFALMFGRLEIAEYLTTQKTSLLKKLTLKILKLFKKSN